ncbi:MAG: hypothetical protein MZW92_45745 [Comamonadaceae bacterium]|nr:hypothetical protein [Comamonadaceae bacterium]
MIAERHRLHLDLPVAGIAQQRGHSTGVGQAVPWQYQIRQCHTGRLQLPRSTASAGSNAPGAKIDNISWPPGRNTRRHSPSAAAGSRSQNGASEQIT